jgi:NDP-sugar pyrophosphorylase family protein
MTLQIVIPMAGRGQRFLDAGYTTPKPLIQLDGCSLIEIVLANVTPTRPHRIIVCALAEHLTDGSLEATLRRVCPDVVVVPVAAITEGPAATVELAAHVLDLDEPLIIANSDQYVDVLIDGFVDSLDGHDGSIMTFHRVDDPKWSYVHYAESGRIDGVVEKVPVSDTATVGIYAYSRAGDFLWVVDEMRRRDVRTNGELYVAPGYTLLASDRGADLTTFDVSGAMHGLGVPADLEVFLGGVRDRATAAVRRLREHVAHVSTPSMAEVA